VREKTEGKKVGQGGGEKDDLGGTAVMDSSTGKKKKGVTIHPPVVAEERGRGCKTFHRKEKVWRLFTG